MIIDRSKFTDGETAWKMMVSQNVWDRVDKMPKPDCTWVVNTQTLMVNSLTPDTIKQVRAVRGSKIGKVILKTKQ